MARVPNAVETLPKIWTAWVGCTSVTDDRQTDRQTDGRATAYSEREREFTFAKNRQKRQKSRKTSISQTERFYHVKHSVVRNALFTIIATYMTDLTFFNVSFIMNCCKISTAHSELRKVLFLAQSVCVLFVSNISGTAERIGSKFTRKTCLVLRLDKLESQGQKWRDKVTHQGQEKRYSSTLSAACVRLMFGEASILVFFYVWWWIKTNINYSMK